ncbi:hypothetical protein [Capnocytophaga cynodegmi]|uniref:hypothetical protein n=1 Tax=Capnocytophaga cynodegmi TaxID=28189 RepID=UPI001AC2EED3|nr:hypothetical protein [Capnocytophaga cynodegmi]GIM54291.1 hypothetical protein CAPN005_09380 [Capnocytophaga cynodegmi]
MKKYVYFTLLILFYFSSCRENRTKNSTFQEEEKVIDTVRNEDILDKKVFFEGQECPCKMPITDGRYGIIIYDESLVDGQKELDIKLCENERGMFAISIEKHEGYDEEGNLNRGKIYDYKVLKINDDYVEFDEGCTLDSGEVLYFVVTSNGIHSIWRIKEGKLIEMDKNKEYPCIDFDADME